MYGVHLNQGPIACFTPMTIQVSLDPSVSGSQLKSTRSWILGRVNTRILELILLYKGP